MPVNGAASITPASLQGLLAIHRYRLLSVDQFAKASGLKTSHVRDVLRVFERKKFLGSIGNVGLRGGSKAPKLYYLTRSGFQAMLDAGGLFSEDIGGYVRPHTSTGWTPVMAHRMTTIDLLIAAETGLVESPDYRLVRTFHEYRRITQGKTQVPETSDYVAEPFDSSTRIVPDAAFICENQATGNRGLFLLESDRGTERLTSGAEGSYSVIDKFRLYERYLRSGRFVERYQEAGGIRFFTVLFVTTSQERIQNARLASGMLGSVPTKSFTFPASYDSLSVKQCGEPWNGAIRLERFGVGVHQGCAPEQQPGCEACR